MTRRLRGIAVAVAVSVLAVAFVAIVWVVVRDTADGLPSGGPTTTGCTADDPCLDDFVTDPPDQNSTDDEPGDDTTTPPDEADPGADRTRTPVDLLITSSGWDSARSAVWVAADVPVVESGGTCTLTLTKGSTKVEESTPAEPGPYTTSCAVEVPKARLSSGEWVGVVSYTSAHHSGAGQEVTIRIP
ncbi:MAG: hypothetical protein FWD11_00935 [Micrococcales bacterium]|nr:hypothetical protein [Micrococcales bacterium]